MGNKDHKATGMQTDRRRVMMLGAVALGSALTTAFATAAPLCRRTPEQTAGPFYPGEGEFAPINDLTRVPGAPRAAEGSVILIKGRVLDRQCRPVPDVNVEIWQACVTGKYNNLRDPNPAPLDPYFRYWGEYDSDPDGSFWFRTIIPGSYPATNEWIRPPHIHVRVSKLGYRELVTQMYFKDHPLNSKDRIFMSTPAAERSALEVAFLESDQEPGVLEGRFDLTILEV